MGKRQNKNGRREAPAVQESQDGWLFHLDCAGRALARAGTAGDARLGVHLRGSIDFDCAHRARTFAHAATDADILLHFSSHGNLQDWLVWGWSIVGRIAEMRDFGHQKPSSVEIYHRFTRL
jgi:hypothetical protein